MNALKLKPFDGPVIASIEVPGSKSYTNRSLLIATMIENPVKIIKPLISDDTKAMLNCFSALGVAFKQKSEYIEVIGNINEVTDKTYSLNCLLSGTTIRFMLALSAILPGIQILGGEPRLNERPIADMVDALVSLGADIEYLGEEGFPPLRVNSHELATKPVAIKGESSSQYISALLMIAPHLKGLHITTVGEVISKPYIDMTIYTMEKFGVKIKRSGYKTFEIAQKKYTGSDFIVEGDVSSASYFFAIAAISKSKITISNLNPTSIQADMGFLKILAQQGNRVALNENSITIEGAGALSATVNMEDCPDQAPTMAVLAAFSDGTTTLKGVQSLRIKETERIIALEHELAKMGIKSNSTKSTLTIHGGNPHSAIIDTYNDHRMAMSFSVAGTVLPDMIINNPEVVSKTFPTYWEKYESLKNNLQPLKKNIVLIGMRGSGKTTVGQLLGKILRRDVIDIDTLISAKIGLTIPRIIELHGWSFFRQQELMIVNQIKNETNKIISTGGGIILEEKNVELLKTNGLIVWLRAQPATLVERISNSSSRPPLTKEKTIAGEIKELLNERVNLYKMSAQKIIDTDKVTSSEVAQKIIDTLKEDIQ